MNPVVDPGEGPGGPPLIVTLNCCMKDWKKFFGHPPPPPPCLSHDLDDQAPPLSEGVDLPLESMLFGFKNPDLNILGKEMHPKI